MEPPGTAAASLEPSPIRRLDEGVVNRIAAGEVIQRPANAVKEMLENSLDAGATQVTITLKEGGVKSLQVQDNGSGVRRDDLGLLCERHATSKLRSFEDLATLGTLGFRGEALASVSYVAHVTVTTMTAEDAAHAHGWRATYKDGAMQPPGPRPCAATPGTTVLAEDLFYNTPLRRKGLRPASEEYAAVLEAVGRYAVYRAGAAITVKRQGEGRADLQTRAGGSREDAVRAVYGAAVAKNLIPLALACGAEGEGGAGGAGVQGGGEGGEGEGGGGTAAGAASQDRGGGGEPGGGLQCAVSGFVTGADYAGRKTQLVLFINGRGVECTPLKRALEGAYAALLPKAAKPFIFLDVRLPPRHVDVNVHPTKREVAFLHQDALIEAVRGAAEAALLTSNAQRTFTQARLPGAPPPPLPPADLAAGGGGEAAAAGQSSYYRPDRLVRTDARAQTLHAFLGAATQQAAAAGQEAGGSAGGAAAEDLEQAGAAAMETDDVQRVEGAGGSEEAPRGAAATAAAAAAAAAAAQPAARRRRGGGGGAAALGGDDEFAFMPTAMEIAGAGAAAAQIQTQPATQTLGRPVRHRLNPAHAAGLGLASVEALLAEAERSPHSGLADILRAPTFVGMADCRRALLQAGTRLYLADLTALSHDMFYQQALRRFAQAPRLRLRPAPSVRALAAAALEAEAAAGRWRDSAEGGTREEVAGLLEALLLKKAAVLRECFGVEVDEGGRLAALPQLIEQYAPHPCRLPAFLLALGQGVEWGEERACFRGVALALAALFQVQPDPGEEEEEEEEWAAAAAAAGDRDGAGEAGGGGGGAPPAARPEREAARRRREWAVEHVVLPALRLFLTPGRGRAGDGSVVELTRLEQLYRVFERC